LKVSGSRDSGIAIDMRKKFNMPQFLGHSQTLLLVSYKITTHDYSLSCQYIPKLHLLERKHIFQMSDLIK